jgi:predicted nucleic acid-binding protein
LDIYAAQGIDFEDALAIAYMESAGISEIISYDRHFDRIEGITRCEP